MQRDALRITLLGAGQEVGRSCCVLRHRGKTVVCDVGIHPAHQGIASLPFIDELDWSTVDAILVTHFHLDHAGALTYITEKTNFREGKGKVYMTHPTKTLHKFMMQDYLRTSTSTDALFTPRDVSVSLESIIPVSVHERVSPCEGVSFIPYHAGHVLGACMFLIDIVGLKILYTGDYSRAEDRHLVRAEVPPIRPDVLIVESTFGVQTLEHGQDKEHRLTDLVRTIVSRGGHALLPVFALGTAQELLLVLDEYWSDHPELHDVPVYYASSLARKCMAVYQTHIHAMNENIRSRFARRDNPFVFKHVTSISRERGWERKLVEGPPCVVLATPGFVHVGASRELLELWAPDPRNGIIITGFSVEGTMARDIQTEPEQIVSLKGTPIPCKLSVDYVPFSAHVDYTQNAEFIELVDPDHIVLVHGEKNVMDRLCAAMKARYKNKGKDINIHTPQNLVELQLSFSQKHVAKAVGTLAAQHPLEGDIISGLLVSRNNTHMLLDAQDLRPFTGLSTCTVKQRQTLAVSASWDLVGWHLGGMFGTVSERIDQDGRLTLRIMDVVDVKHASENEMTIEWESSASNDMVADSAMALVAGVDRSPASLQLTALSTRCTHPHAKTPNNWMRHVFWFLEAHFGQVTLDVGTDAEQNASPNFTIRCDEATVYVDANRVAVVSVDEMLKSRIEAVINMAISTTGSLADLFSTGVPMPAL
ncbi:beta-lactamase-like protein [Pisolithus orientalis]|uniref:beta-lactamase-like protein n=1 Tax=Pisolithus orientalis TaxID=936130 RepID=UPI00222516EC|nr:beta-lactamase-like protein [Pisolithus orientalis]KAI6033007.1 beta-lactamase-like protein [Pisolithus orientalis]